MSSHIVLLARRPRPRWRRIASVVLAVALAIALLANAVAAQASDVGSISGRAFHDADRDGVLDAGETVRSGDTIWLFDQTAGTFLTRQDTGTDGSFRFDGLATGRTYRVQLETSDWWERWESEVPTTTPGLRPIHDVVLSGDAVRDFGWRQIETSSVGSPMSAVTSPEGLTVESYNDAVSAQQVLDVLETGLVGEEAPATTVRLAAGGASTTATSVQQSDGRYHSFRAIVNVTWLAWLSEDVPETLSHEYGHAWGWFHAYETQQDPTMSGYLHARGLADDSRVDSSYAWSRAELLAEDYQQLLGPVEARAGGQINREIPLASEVPGLESYLRDDFTTGTAAEPTPEPTPEPTSEPTPEPTEDVVAPDVDVIAPSEGTSVPQGQVEVVVLAQDNMSPAPDVRVQVTLGDRSVTALYDTSRGRHIAVVDTSGLKGSQPMVVSAEDAAGNTASVEGAIEVSRSKGGGGGGGSDGPNCRGKRC